MKKNVKVGIIGAGRIGKLHAENIAYHIPEAEIVAIADVYADQIREWAANLGVPMVTNDYKDILNNPDIDAVVICSSTDTHARFTIEAAKAGKHVFCEKPIDLTVEKVKQAIEAVKEAGVKLQIGFNRRFDHNHKRVRDAVLEGKIGAPHIIKITSRDPAPPPIEYVKVSGGLFMDMTIHDFDMARYLSGSEVEEVYASGAVLVDPAIGDAGDIDTAVITLKFKNGAIGVIDNSRKAAYGYDQRLEVFGSKGCMMNFNDTPSSAVLSTVEGVFSEKPKYFFLERYKDSFIAEMKEFFNAILNDTETPVTGIDGLKPVLIALAAKKSMEEGRPVKIEEIEKAF
ncbi:MAG: myo-inositol 2-dehydrogenase / D-chiro-inositol 1-dehydrogenase [Petroclostridium sp.]|jgi:myo-inositol 2-dehydrogenase/D-chiro-inositol 1-dehydrogenase|uniref:inositol 2-dehydrogenase n=1 Tax=Petroclostridium xylanilyticum TaxID=1792311 RepID=UPI000B9861E5|nr:inositol 2-dehydrogenase [Petroclostridium xylanilyticum]MDK2811693.1 myo-inositol 2-dehydrogenase / D-chiro-inositol 1-dehydrogenase [Petroclostridium sp.]